jgi:hypothetical protein
MRLMVEFPREILDVDVRLVGIDPPIWRRLEVPTYHTLDELHQMLRVLLGGPPEPFHAFYWRRRIFCPINPEWSAEEIGRAEDSREIRLCDLAIPPGEQLTFKDASEEWPVLVEVVSWGRRRRRSPVCTAGERATPPSTIDVASHYAELLTVLATPPALRGPDEEVWEVSPDFDPERFNRNLFNALLRRWGDRAI